MFIDRRQFVRLVGGSLLALFTGHAPATRPATRSLVLSRFFIAGFCYYRGLDLVDRLRAGDAVELRGEPTNPHDRRAIEIYWRGHKLGYVPRAENKVPGRLLAQGAPLRGHIVRVRPEGETWEMVQVRLVLPTGTFVDAGPWAAG
jgi:hypothetical protein